MLAFSECWPVNDLIKNDSNPTPGHNCPLKIATIAMKLKGFCSYQPQKNAQKKARAVTGFLVFG